MTMDFPSMESRISRDPGDYGAERSVPVPRPVQIPAPPLQARPSFEEIYRGYFDYVWTNLRRLGVSEGELDDAVQDVFLVLHRRAEEFEGRSTIKTWLYGITRRIAFRYRRAAERTRRRSQALKRIDFDLEDLDREVATRQAWAMLYAFLDTLDDEKREAFVVGEFEGLNRQELGVALGVNPNTAYSRLRAARERFNRVFASDARRNSMMRAERQREAPEDGRQRVWALLIPQIGLAPGVDATTGLEQPFASAAQTATQTSLVSSAVVYAKVAVVAFAVAGLTALGVTGLDHDSNSDASVAGGSGSPAVVSEPIATDSSRLDAGEAFAVAGDGSSQPGVAGRDAPSGTVDKVDTRRRTKTRVRKPKRSSGSDAASAEALAAEVELVRAARRALAKERGGKALALLRRYAREHRHGELAVVGKALRIDALCQLGRESQAAQEARSFLARHGDSSEAARVKRSCGVAGSNGP